MPLSPLTSQPPCWGLCLTKEEDHVTLYCMALILLGSWGRDLSWLLPILPARYPPLFLRLRAFCTCAWPLAALAAAFAYAKYSFWKDLFSSSGQPPSSLP